MDQRPLGDALVRMGLLTEGQLDAMLSVQRREGRQLSRQLVDAGFLTEERLVQVLGEQLGIETVDLADVWVHERVRALVLGSVARKLLVMPLACRKVGSHDALLLAMADPLDDDAVAVVGRRLPPDMRVVRLLAGEHDLHRAITMVYGEADAGTPLPAVDDLKLPSPPGFSGGDQASEVPAIGPEPTLDDAPPPVLGTISGRDPFEDPLGDPATAPSDSPAPDLEGLTESAVPAMPPSPSEVARLRAEDATQPRAGEPQKLRSGAALPGLHPSTEVAVPLSKPGEPATQPVGVDHFSAALVPDSEPQTAVSPTPMPAQSSPPPPDAARPTKDGPRAPISGIERKPMAVADRSDDSPRLPKSGKNRSLPRAPATEIVRARAIDAPVRLQERPLERPVDRPSERSPERTAERTREPTEHIIDDPRRRKRDVTRRVGPPQINPAVDRAEAPEPEILVRAVAHRIPPALLGIASLSLVVIVGVGAWSFSRPPTVQANLTRAEAGGESSDLLDNLLDEAPAPDPPLAPIRRPAEIAPGVVDGPPPPGHRFVLQEGLELRATAAPDAEALLWLKGGQIVRVIEEVERALLVLVPPEGPAGFVDAEALGDRRPLTALARALRFKNCTVAEDGQVDECLYGARTQWEDCRLPCRSGTRCAPACQAAFDACLTSCRASEQSRREMRRRWKRRRR